MLAWLQPLSDRGVARWVLAGLNWVRHALPMLEKTLCRSPRPWASPVWLDALSFHHVCELLSKRQMSISANRVFLPSAGTAGIEFNQIQNLRYYKEQIHHHPRKIEASGQVSSPKSSQVYPVLRQN